MENDAELVKSVLSGNINDFRKLLERYQYSAERWAFHHVKNLADAENIAQEAFVEAYFRLDVLRDPNRFGSWLHSMVNNTAISWLRRRKLTVSFEEIDSIYSGGVNYAVTLISMAKVAVDNRENRGQSVKYP